MNATMAPVVPRRRESTLTFSRNWLIHIANETLDIARCGKYTNRHGKELQIGDALLNAMENSVHYHSSHVFSNSDVWKKLSDAPPLETEFHICYGSSLQVAASLKDRGGHVGILNSASAKHPGGKFYVGNISQEDCLCRASLLYPCLLQFEDKEHHFYFVNNKSKYKESSSACAIFSPHVPVIRNDDARGELLDEFHTCSFVSIPAPNAFVVGSPFNRLGAQEADQTVPKAQKPGSDKNGEMIEYISVKDAMHDRLHRALSIFAEHGCSDLVLCAFGCGVHGNHPETVASIFKDILNNELKGRFRTVVFAIQPSRTTNYKAFRSVFPDAYCA